MNYIFALTGNPNSGKTTIFNELTGSKQKIGNWAGVTVEKKVGKIKKSNVWVIDLPGVYSLSPYTTEEIIARDYLINEKPDVILNIVDASNIERNLLLTTQLLELNIPVIVVLNMIDIVERRGDKININKLNSLLNVPVITVSALKNKGLEDITKKALVLAKKKKDNYDNMLIYSIFDDNLNEHINETIVLIEKENIGNDKFEKLWLAIKLLENDKNLLKDLKINEKAKQIINNKIDSIKNYYNNDVTDVIIDQRHKYIQKVIQKSLEVERSNFLNISDKIDKIVLNKFLAIPIFFCIMWFIYFISIQTLGNYTIGWLEYSINDIVSVKIEKFLQIIGTADLLNKMILEAVIGGVGGVIVFVPQLMILFFFISLLEDSGYMARVAFFMDRVFRKFGLSGKSFIPMIVGTGCSVPGIMATRTIENEANRKITIFLTPFIPCGAKLPVFALFIAAFFSKQAWVAPSIYILGIGAAIFSGVLLKNTLFKGEITPFIMELPEYKIPKLKNALINMWAKGKNFVKKAGTIIFAASIILWGLQSFNFSFNVVETKDSILAIIGKIITPIFAPLGFGNWQAVVSIFTGFFAKEIIVSTFGVLYEVGSQATQESSGLVKAISENFNMVSAYAFMVFVLFASPCIAAIATMKQEFNSWRYTLFALIYQTSFAWIMAMIVYQVGRRIFLV